MSPRPPGPRYTAVIEALPHMTPFVGPEAQERARGRPFRARIGANESVFGPSPKAVAAIQASAGQSWKYSDPDNHELKAAIARFHGVGYENVVVTEGIDGGLGLACRLVLDPGDAVVTSDGAYPTFNFHVLASGGALTRVAFRDDREDLVALLDHARRLDAKLVYVSNPNNPMGSWWEASEIDAMIGALPAGTVLLLDEAYSDTAPASAIPALDVSNPQVLRLRTFSKAYGLAGARIGYALGEAGLIANFEKVRNHYGINLLGQVAAKAALEDQGFLKQAVARIAAARAAIAEVGRANGLKPLPSATNFVTMDCGRDGVFAKRVIDGLLARDIFVRMPAVAPLNRCIRISAGHPADIAAFAEALGAAIGEARADG